MVLSEKIPVFIGLGSNLGNRLEHLKSALEYIAGTGKVTLQAVSPIYETEPMGPEDQNRYLNAVMKAVTGLTPETLFDRLKHIEKKIGRKERKRWSSREIDLDILFYGDLIMETEMLTIPHPGITERDFVLKPLCDIAPDFIHPALKKKISDICNTTEVSFIINDRFADVKVSDGQVVIHGTGNSIHSS